MRFSILLAALSFGHASPALSQSDCAATTMGQIGCAPGVRPYVTQMGDTLGSRGNDWYTNDPDPNDDVLGAYPYNDTLGRTTDPSGRAYSTTLGGGCDPLVSGDC